MQRLLKGLNQVARAMERVPLVDRDDQNIEDLKVLDEMLVRIHRVCHNFKDDASRSDVIQRWTRTPAWR